MSTAWAVTGAPSATTRVVPSPARHSTSPMPSPSVDQATTTEVDVTSLRNGPRVRTVAGSTTGPGLPPDLPLAHAPAEATREARRSWDRRALTAIRP